MPRQMSTSLFVALILAAVASLFLGAVGVVGYRSHSGNLRAVLTTKHDVLADQLATSLALPVWNFDRLQITKIAESAMRDRDIEAVVVKPLDVDPAVFVRDQAGSSPTPATREALSAPHLLIETREITNRGERIGTVTVYATPLHVERALGIARGWAAAVIVGTALLLFITLYGLLWRTLLRPLKYIERYAVALSTRSAERETLRGKQLGRELAVLRDSLEGLLQENGALYDREKQLNAGLAERQEELHHALTVRDEFLIVASHELKTPITSLKLQLQLLRRGVKPDQGVAPAAGQLAKALDASTVQVDRLTRLINDMLDISRMQSGELSVLPEPMNLAELVREVVERLTPDLTSARCPITVEVDPDLRIKADRARLEQVIVNLVSNAIKYAAGTAISVRVHQNDIGTQIDVSDEGPGIAPDKQSVIFECFERGAATRNVAGLGLGLYICRRLVEAHGGTISVDSAIARGATFHIALPRELTVTRAEGLRESA